MAGTRQQQEFVSPDSVDELISVTSNAGWLQLGAIGAIVLGLIVWSTVTDIPIKVKTKGMVLSSEGVAEVTMAARGRLTELNVKSGDMVKKGDLVALVAQPELESQISVREFSCATPRPARIPCCSSRAAPPRRRTAPLPAGSSRQKNASPF